jgi:glycoside/pentoside/hexuronide:cation symporter, GPH family
VSFVNLLFQIALGIGGGVAIGVAGLFGFSTTQGTQSEEAIFGLKLGFAILPLGFALISLLLISRTPLDRRRHAIIQRRIESRVVMKIPA